MPRRQAPLTLLATALIAGILLLAGWFGWLKPLQSLAGRVFSPIASALYRAGGIFRPGQTDGKSASQLADELKTVQTENRRLQAEQARLSGVDLENNRLREYLNFLKVKPVEYQLARVVARGQAADAWQSQQTLTLNRGSRDGLKTGMAIIDSEGILLGRLTEVTDSTSQACLLFDTNCRIAVGIEGQPGTIGVIQSDLNLTVKVDFITQNRSVAEGQTIVTSGLETNLPPNLVVGTVAAIIKQGNELWQHAVIRPSGNFDDLNVVAVIK